MAYPLAESAEEMRGPVGGATAVLQFAREILRGLSAVQDDVE